MRRILSVFALALASAAAVAAGGTAAPEKLRLAIGYIPHVQFTPLYVGQEQGFYRREGIELEISYGFGVDVFSLLAAEKIDIGLSDSDQLIIAGSKDLGLVAVFQYYQRYPVAIVARADRVREAADLAGKRIGTPELYGTSYIGLRLFLRRFGLEDRVTIERIGYTQVESLQAGRLDAAVCFSNNEPLVMAAQGLATRQWEVREFSDMVGASFITSRPLLARRVDALERFVRATRQATAWTVDHREEAFRIALRAVGSVKKEDEPLMRRRLDATVELFASPGGYGWLDRDRWQRSIAELTALGLIPDPFPADRVLAPIAPGR